MQKLLNPGVYDTEVARYDQAIAELRGGRCACGYTYFPMQAYGCEKCGATESSLTEKRLSGRGTLVASADVHLHFGGGPKAPFVVGTIELDDGPTVRALLAEEKAGLTIGDPMEAILTSVGENEEGDENFDLRFRKLGGAK